MLLFHSPSTEKDRTSNIAYIVSLDRSNSQALTSKTNKQDRKQTQISQKQTNKMIMSTSTTTTSSSSNHNNNEFILINKSKNDFRSFRRKQSLEKHIKKNNSKSKFLEILHSTEPIVEILIRGCRDLVAADSNGKSDPYCVIFCGERGKERRLKSSKRLATLNPVFNEVFDFSVKIDPATQLIAEGQHLRIEVWDWDFLSRDDFIGVVSVPLNRLPRDLTVFMDLPLCGVEKGSVQIEITAHNFGTTVANVEEPRKVIGVDAESGVHADAAIIRHASRKGFFASSDMDKHIVDDMPMSTSEESSSTEVDDISDSEEKHSQSISRRYRNTEMLGSGFSAMVYLAHDMRTDEQVAVKKVACRSFDEASQALQEAFIIRKICHPNVVDFKNVFLETFEADAFDEPCFGVCLVMEHYVQGDVARFLRAKHATGKPFLEDRLYSYIAQLASAMTHLHSNNILHRDIKVRCVMFIVISSNIFSIHSIHHLPFSLATQHIHCRQLFDPQTGRFRIRDVHDIRKGQIQCTMWNFFLHGTRGR